MSWRVALVSALALALDAFSARAQLSGRETIDGCPEIVKACTGSRPPRPPFWVIAISDQARHACSCSLREGTVVDASIVQAPSSTKNRRRRAGSGDAADEEGEPVALRDDDALDQTFPSVRPGLSRAAPRNRYRGTGRAKGAAQATRERRPGATRRVPNETRSTLRRPLGESRARVRSTCP